MTWLAADVFVDGRIAGIPYGAEVLRRARVRTLALPDLQLRLRSHPRLQATRRPLRAESVLDAIVDVETFEPRETGFLDGVVVLRFAALLRPPLGALAADIWLDERLRIRRIAAVPSTGRGSGRLRRAMTGRVPRGCCWTLDVAFGRLAAAELPRCPA